MNDKHNILRLFDRPQEPVFGLKGDKNTVFDVPHSFLTDRYKPIGQEIANRVGEDAKNKINVSEITAPDLGIATSLDRKENFTLFIPRHRKIAAKLIDVFLAAKDTNDLQSTAVYARDRVNPYLFNYALSVALLHREDTQDIDIPAYVHFFPDKFVDSKVFTRAREEATIVPEARRAPIEIPMDFTASNLESEHRLAYFREDMGINLHHWHWHLVYPFEAARSIVAKNRRGELFYYMHQQIIARYNFERFSNKMNRVVRWNDWKAPIPEAYFPKLDSLVASRTWPARVEGQVVQDLNRAVDQIRVDVDDLFRWRDRFFSAIQAGFVNDARGTRIDLTENEGIDILGDMMEASLLSPNRQFYGDLHNMGHVFLSYIHDPDHRHLESFGVIGDSATAMRDPIFYRWHAYVDDVFQTHKSTLPRYGTDRLGYQGVTVTNVEVRSQGAQNNVLNTFWQQSDVDLSRGMDFQPRGPVLIRFTHLQHHPFSYNITVNNQGGQARQGTCRIFMSPKFDERGNPWLYRDQRHLMIELDKFTVNLTPGQNNIQRLSTDSSVTIPFDRTFRNLDLTRPQGGTQLATFNFCGCGWPQHMLIPKGSPEGTACELFVMISNINDDRVQQTTDGICNDSASYCGLMNKLYPDRRSMGYPFDREPRDGVDTMQQFLTANMKTQDVTIRFTDQVVRPKQ